MQDDGDMSGPELAALAKTLGPLARAVFRRVRRLHFERRAERMPLALRHDLLDRTLDETLSRLRGGQIDEAWWRELLICIEHKVVAPDFLRKPALQEWLGDEQVGSDFKALARARIMGADEDDKDGLERLRRAYEESTGEHRQYAEWPIRVVLAVLVAGYMGTLDPQLAPIAGMVQASAQESRVGFGRVHTRLDELIQQVGPDPLVVEVHTRSVSDELDRILKRRSVEAERAREEIRHLVQRMTEGDLLYAEPSVRTKALYWASRLHALQKEMRPVAKRYLEQLRAEDAGFDTRIIEALIMETEGDVDGALRALRDIDQPDARSVLVGVLLRTQGERSALAWFDEHTRRGCPGFLTGLGWANVAVTLARMDRWEESAACLAAAGEQAGGWPDLAFIEGVVNAAMLLPSELRGRTLAMDIFHSAIKTVRGPDADRYRARAYTCFDRAARLLEEIGATGRVSAAREWELWLRLTDPNDEIVQAARREVREGMNNGSRAVDLLPLALTFEIRFNDDPLRRYLRQRAQAGGLDERELVAELLLAKATLTPRDLTTYLEREQSRFSKVAPKATFVGMMVEALIADGQVTRAKRLLEEHRSDLPKDNYERFSALALGAEGGDPRAKLEQLYNQTGALIDLKNLVEYLGRIGDWPSLRHLLGELFRRERNAENAHRLIACLQRDSTVGHSTILAFFEANEDVAAWSHDLASAKAWALFHMGRLKEAQTINDELRHDRDSSVDLQLDINLAIQSGKWERFQAIVDHEWDKREGHQAETLLRLASLAAQTDATAERAHELAKLAVRKAPDDPKVLMSAYVLAVQLGRETEAEAGWMARAAELSSAEGPVWKVSPRVIAEQMVPAQRERTREVERNLMRGAIPLHLAATALNTPLSRVLIDLPRRNAEQPDGRRRAIVPIISGARQPVPIKREWIVGLDVTAIMVLEYLELIRPTLDALGGVTLASGTMSVLLDESRRVRFHQPSRVRHAEEIRRLIEEGRLAPPSALPEPPPWLVEEVGRDLAEMLEKARAGGGRVVRPRPIYKLSTYLETRAQLGDYADLVLSTRALARLLFERGHLDRETYERGLSYLVAHDRDETGGEDLDPNILDRSLYLDDLAVIYLQQAGLLQAACRSGIKLHIHPSLRAEQDAIVSANREGEWLAAALDKIRLALRDALETGKAVFLPWRRAGDEDADLPTLSQFVADTGPCEAVCIDDRFINQHPVVSDQAGHTVPIVCTLDLLRYLEAQDVLQAKQRQAAFHRLREGGFALLSLEPEELEGLLRAARLDHEGALVESAELRVLRQLLMRIRSLDLVELPLEERFLAGLRLACVLAIRRLWQDEALAVDRAATLSNWVWRNISPSPLDWAHAVRHPERMLPVPDAFARHVGLLLTPIPGVTDARHEAVRDWVERDVLEPLLSADPGLVDAVAKVMKAQIEEWCDEFGRNATGASS